MKDMPRENKPLTVPHIVNYICREHNESFQQYLRGKSEATWLASLTTACRRLDYFWLNNIYGWERLDLRIDMDTPAVGRPLPSGARATNAPSALSTSTKT